MTTMREVAERSGVSSKTVSRVLRGEGYVSDEVRTRVLAAVDELRYVPNMLAVTFRAGRDAAIGVAVPDLADPFFAQIIQAVASVARQRRTAVIVTSLGYDGEFERPAVEALLQRQLLGLIACPVGADQSYLEPWLARTPAVFVDRPARGLTADCVIEDDFGGGRLATKHLVEHGHRRGAFVGDALSTITTRQRLKGYAAALADAGIDRDDDLVYLGETDAHSLDAGLARLVGLADPVTAVFSSNARCTLDLVPALQRIRPVTLGLVSFGDFPMAASLDPPVTAVDQNPGVVGTFAAQRLFARIAEPDKRLRRRTVLPVGLIERASCALPS